MAEPLTLRIRIVKTNTLKMMQVSVRGEVRWVWVEGECECVARDNVGLMDVRVEG